MTIEQDIKALGPWISNYYFDGHSTGGWFHVLADARVPTWLGTLDGVKTVLECGSLEGGHTAIIAAFPGIERVVGVEGREANIKKCRFAHQQFGITNSEFVQANLETLVLASLGEFDATFCSGVLYHLMRPLYFLKKLTSRYVFLGTHYTKESPDTFEGLPGRWYPEQGIGDVLSGLGDKSFWLTLDSIDDAIRESGYLPYSWNAYDSPNGPWVDIMARKQNVE